MLLPMKVCFGAASPLRGGQELVSTVDVCERAEQQCREGLSRLGFAALFSLGFSPLYCSPCSSSCD